jgi:hypothetical protein
MGEAEKKVDVKKLLQDARDGVMDAWAKLTLHLTSSHEYQRLQGMIAKPALLGYALFRKTTESVMSPFLAQMNMPSREEVLGIAQRLTHIEMTLDDLGAALEQLRRSAGARPQRGPAARDREVKPENGSSVAAKEA